jgi:general secretion pathway protein D
MKRKKHTVITFLTAIAVITAIFTIINSTILKNSGVLRAQQAPIKLNVHDMEITEFLKMMSNLTGKNIIADDKVRGKITIVSSKEIPVNEAYDLMKSILQIKGFAVIESDNIVKVVTISDAIENNSEIIIENDDTATLKGDSTVTYIYEVKNQNAAQIRNVLNTLKSRYTKIVSFDDLNYIIISGIASEIEGLIKIAKTLDVLGPEEEQFDEEGTVSKGNIHVIHLQNANAEKLAGVLSRVPFSETAKINTAPTTPQVRGSGKAANTTQTTNTAASLPATKLSIIANAETNSLIITATPDEFRQIKSIISQLDVVREQVMIEALIVEVSADNGWGFGIDWLLGHKEGDNIVGGTQILSTNNFQQSEVLGKTTPLPLNQGFQLGYVSDRSQLGFLLLNASATDNNFNILSTPQILTIDNQEAEINVGQQFPVPTNNQTSTEGNTSISYEYKEASLKLKITPHITKEGKITLELYQEVNSVEGAATTLGNTIIPPNLNTRNLSTRISIDDGKTIVVGGLISNNNSEQETKVPVLGDVPVIGWLFKRKVVSYEKRNLLVFITPHIVTDPKKLEELTNQKNEEIKIIE